MRTRGLGPVFYLAAVLLFGLGGSVLGSYVGFFMNGPRWPGQAEQREWPLPHHVPKYKDGISLRFAMVHDVLHERFPHHSKEYYTERNRLAELALKKEKTKARPNGEPAAAYFDLLDDLAAGHDYMGDHETSVRLMRDKFTQQQKLGYKGRQLYSTYANLGTFILLDCFQKATTGDPEAKAQLREALDLIHQAMAINPQAHFGREIWQAVLMEYLLEAIDKPKILLTYDFAGNRLDQPIDPSQRRNHSGWGSLSFAPYGARAAAHFLSEDRGAKDSRWDANESRSVEEFRKHITRIGAEQGWKDEIRSSHKEPVPFDEPTLGIVGMWRLGAGALPQFALPLGEIMMRVGQRYIAWCAYERAVKMAQGYWPDPEIQRKFIEHCRSRQAIIEKQLPAADVAELRSKHEAELAFGRRWQKAYQQYEADQIAAGKSIDDTKFYDAFYAEHGQIASPVGEADKFVTERSNAAVPLPSILLGAGFFGLVGAWLIPISRKSTQAATPEGSGPPLEKFWQDE